MCSFYIVRRIQFKNTDGDSAFFCVMDVIFRIFAIIVIPIGHPCNNGKKQQYNTDISDQPLPIVLIASDYMGCCFLNIPGIFSHKDFHLLDRMFPGQIILQFGQRMNRLFVLAGSNSKFFCLKGCRQGQFFFQMANFVHFFAGKIVLDG